MIPRAREVGVTGSLFPSPVLRGYASAVLEQYEAWCRDQAEPPSLREGHRCPSQQALDLARMVLTEAENA